LKPGDGLEILTVAEMAAADAAAIEGGISAEALMERAGATVAGTIAARWPAGLANVLCGPGGNGGDGYVIARHLKAMGWTVEVEALGEPSRPDAAAMAAKWDGPVRHLTAEAPPADLVVDALFGAGLARPLEGPAAARARHRAPTVAVDLPSGLNGDTGLPVGPDAFHAALTVTFHRRKPVHVLEPGRTACGEVMVADIGLGQTLSSLWENQPALWRSRMHWPTAASHKHSRGRLAVVSGGLWNTGAARLAARAGLRSGAGFVTLLSPPEALIANAAHLEAVVLRPFSDAGELSDLAQTADAAVIGPAAGVGPETVAHVAALVQTGAAMVIDADALTSFRDDPRKLFQVLDRDDVLTPHAGEFGRVFPGLLESAAEKISAVREAAHRAGCVVLLKGPDTTIAAPDGRCAVNLNGTPWLATAGSGDVLAGLIAGLIAQGMESFEAACAGVWIHAEAAAGFGPGLTAEDLPDLLPPVLKALYEGR